MRNKLQLTCCLLGLITLLTASCSEEKKAEIVESIRPVKYGTIQMSGDALKESFSGTAQSSKESKMSFKVSGTISQLNVKIGDIVRKGQLIARIDQTDYSVQYQQSVANLKSVETSIKSANTQLVNAKATYERVEKLYENNSVSISEFEQAKSAYETAKASHTAAQAQANASEKQVESAQNQVKYSNLLAPFSGVVSSVEVEENELIGSGQPVATISTVENPEILVGMPEIFISKVKKGQTVDIKFSSLTNASFTGRVNEVGFSSLGGSTYPVTVRINQPTPDIRPGMAAEVSFDFSGGKGKVKSEMIAPVAAVGEDSNGHFVFTLVKEDQHYKVAKKTIQLGNLNSAGFEVKSGLADGDLVATAGLSTLLDGMKVRLIDQK